MLLAGKKWRSADVEQHLGPVGSLLCRRPTRIPDILTDRDTTDHASHLEYRSGGSSAEVAVFIEDTVVGEILLVIDAHALAAIKYGSGIEEVGVTIDESHNGTKT